LGGWRHGVTVADKCPLRCGWLQGYKDPTVLSPEIDQLAKSGVILTSMYTWSWCAPSRGAIMSGRYASNR
jgi:arylsulfatase A-like enzyme